MAGYQKPKPRQFLQPLPQKLKVNDDFEVEAAERKKKGPKQRRTNSAQKGKDKS